MSFSISSAFYAQEKSISDVTKCSRLSTEEAENVSVKKGTLNGGVYTIYTLGRTVLVVCGLEICQFSFFICSHNINTKYVGGR